MEIGIVLFIVWVFFCLALGPVGLVILGISILLGLGALLGGFGGDGPSDLDIGGR